MSKPEFKANGRNTKYFDALNKYMECHVLRANGKFVCKHEKECKASCSNGQKFHYGQLHHVGPLYDLKRNGKPFRVMVSGAEYSYGTGPHSLKKRTCEINKCNPDNPHMRGTLCLLQILFEEVPENGVLETTINKKSEKIFHAFSMSNFLLCSGIYSNSPSGAYTDRMTENCKDHYQRTLEILKPQIVIIQGVRSRDCGFWARYGKQDMVWNPDQLKIERIKIAGCNKDTLILPLYHPSYRRKFWGGANSKAIENHIKPAVDNLLKEYEKIHG